MNLIRNTLVTSALLLSDFSAAQSDSASGSTTCPRESEFSKGFNASGSITVPGPRINDSYPETAWTWTRYMIDKSPANNTDNVDITWTTLGLQTSPLQNLSDPNIPYMGCLIVPTTFFPSKGAENDDGTCTSVLSSECVEELISKVNATVASLSRDPAGTSQSRICSRLLDSVDGKNSKCKNFWSGVSSMPFLLANDPEIPPPKEDSCLDVNPGNSNATHRAFFAWGGGGRNHPNAYDEALKIPQPVIVAAWLKPTDGVRNSDWAYTQLMCIRANNTEPGSRKASGAEGSNSGAEGRNGGLGVFAFVGLSVLISVFL